MKFPMLEASAGTIAHDVASDVAISFLGATGADGPDSLDNHGDEVGDYLQSALMEALLRWPALEEVLRESVAAGRSWQPEVDIDVPDPEPYISVPPKGADLMTDEELALDHEAREWLTDIGADPDDLDDRSYIEVKREVSRKYEGGWGAFRESLSL